MKAIKPIHVVLTIGALLTLYLLITFTKRTKPDHEAKLYEQIIEAKEQTIQAVQSERKAWEEVAATKDSLIAGLKAQTDKHLQAANKNTVYYIENKKKYEAIPNAVRNLSADSLQRAIEAWYR